MSSSQAGAAPATGPVLQAAGLCVTRDGVGVLDAVDFELERGEVVALLGPNGAGKSTLLATVAGLLTPRSGRLERSGRVAAALQESALAQRTVAANVRAALAWWGVPRRERAARAQTALESMGAGHLNERVATTLSGGEARRVHLARALALRPDVLLLDEPFAGLDAPTRGELLADAASVVRDPSRGTLVVVHDRAEAWALADRVIVLLGGRVAASGPPGVLFTKPPTPAVADFVGFSGHVRDETGLLLLRPQDVVIAEDGERPATVKRLVPVEAGMRVELAVAGGVLHAISPLPGPRVGDTVRVSLRGGERF